MQIKTAVCFLGPDQITEGFYKVEGRQLHMMRPAMIEGVFAYVPYLLADEPVIIELSPESNPEQVAKIQTKRLRRIALGDDADGFWRKLSYEKDSGVI